MELKQITLSARGMATMHYVPRVLASRFVQQNLEFHADPTEKTFKTYTHFLSLGFHTIDPLYGWFAVNHHKLDSGDRSLRTTLPLCPCLPLTPVCLGYLLVPAYHESQSHTACCLNQAVTIVTMSNGDYYWVNVVDYILCTW